MTGKIMPLCERSTNTIQAVADAVLIAPRHVNRNTRCGCMGNSAHWRLVTDSDNSMVARHAISAAKRGRGDRCVHWQGRTDRADLSSNPTGL